MSAARPAAPKLIALLSLVALAASPAVAQEPSAWTALEQLRESLIEASPMAATFSQTFTPAGFASGDTEGGTLYLGLPECARWDYGDPFPRTYLLCGNVAWSWNDGETSGRRFEVSVEERAGLDLLRLDVAKLRQSFGASVSDSGPPAAVRLEPLGDAIAVLDATLFLSADGRRLTSLRFTDVDGNETLFEIGSAVEVEGTASFEPPAGIEWLEN